MKGFGLTLLIGIISSLFTALFVTKTIFAILIDKYGIKELGSMPTSFPKWDKLLKPNIDWMAHDLAVRRVQRNLHRHRPQRLRRQEARHVRHRVRQRHRRCSSS